MTASEFASAKCDIILVRPEFNKVVQEQKRMCNVYIIVCHELNFGVCEFA